MLQLAALLLTVGLLSPCLAEEFFVAPTTDASCSLNSSCHTLDQYASNSSLLDGYSNISLVFMSGVHNLSQDMQFPGTNVEFQGQGVEPEDTVIHLLSLIQFNGAYLKLSNIQLVYGKRADLPDNLFVWNVSTVSAVNVKAHQMKIRLYSDFISIVNCVFTGSGASIVDDYFDCLVTCVAMRYEYEQCSYNCLLMTSTFGVVQASNISVQNSMISDGGGFIQANSVSVEKSNFTDFTTIKGLYVWGVVTVSIRNSQFSSSNISCGLHISRADSVSIENSHFTDHFLGFCVGQAGNISIKNSNFTKSTDIAVYISQADSVSIENSHFTHNFLGLDVYQSYWVSVKDSVFSDISRGIQCRSNSLLIVNTSLITSALGVTASNAESVLIQNVTLFGPNFQFGLVMHYIRNVIITNSLIMSGQIGITCSLNSALTIHNTTITDNSFGLVIGDIDLYFDQRRPVNNSITSILGNIFTSHSIAALVLLNAHENTVTTRDCSFTENQGTPVVLYQSTITLEGENIFRDNTAERGGGLALFDSTVIFSPKSNTSFINNTAREFGGAIYISTVPIPLPQLFVAVENINDQSILRLRETNSLLKLGCFHSTSNDSQITFTGNTAVQGGYDIYGPTLYSDDCLVTDNPVFSFAENIQHALQVSSDPSRVCFCLNNTRQCEDGTQLIHNEMRYPGESFKVSVTLAGYDYGRVAGLVYANVLGQDYTEVLGDGQHIQDVNLTECAELEYTVFSNPGPVELVLTAKPLFVQGSNEKEINADVMDVNSTRCREGTFPCTALLNTPIYIRVTLEECPLGFQLNNMRRCDCENILADLISTNLTCGIQNARPYINREGRVWVGVDTRQNTTNVYYWHENCPSGYCNSSNVPVTLTSPDVQCSLSRSGMLCGGCQANHSLMLGGNKCSNECSNHSIAWILLFAVFGVLLVVFIKVLDLTVANGTINGLIFYANVVWANRAILFSLQDRLSIGYYIITVPIAWLNLDFGIEICFSQDLDQLTKTGLQFVFPVYIWCIAGLIILVSHYSTKATKLFGSNSVAVLATLFLLSYGKLVRNITDVFNFADIMNSNSSARKVWSLDGNVRYGTGGHIALIIFAIIFLILLLLFTSTLLLVPLLRGMSDRRPLHWINTLKPFFDTFYGPFKDKKQHHLWTGILLISRVIILIAFAATSTINPDANILLLTMISMLLLMYSASVGLLYKKWTVSFLENSYILNLMFLGAAFLFITISQRGNYKLNPVTATSVCIALFQFSCILIGHLVKQVLSIGKVQAYIVTRRERQRETEGNNNDLVVAPEDRQEGVTYQVVEIPKCDYELDGEKYNIQYREELFDTNV